MPSQLKLFDWSDLDRYSIANYFWQLHTELLSTHIKQNKIHKIISTHIKNRYPIKISQCFSAEVDLGIIFIGGMYYSDLDQTGKKSIEINFVYNSKNDTYCIDSRRMWRMSLCFADTLLHEIIHMRQYRRRNFKDLPDYSSTAEKSDKAEEQSYLGCSDEIDAYGFNIACELLEKFKGNQNYIIKYLDENQKNKKRKNNCWRMYLKAFDHNHNHEIIKKLKKKVIHYLPYAELGKPYRNKDWIIG